MDKKLTYLICPLNWGLGHASRMIPIVYKLLKDGHEVILGGDGDALKLITQEFPNLKQINIPDIKVNFKHRWMILNLLLLIPKIIHSALREHRLIKSIQKVNSIDVIISDNRYGLRNRDSRSIFITHQIMVKLPTLFKPFEYLTHLIIKKAILRFDECWIPDYKESEKSLSGDLSHKYRLPPNSKYIGPLSRYTNVEASTIYKSYDIVALLSGPEPHRSQLEQKLIELLQNTEYSAIIIQGKPNSNNKTITLNNLDIISHLSADIIKSHILQSKVVICRSGYTSIMDITLVKSKALLIPTPKQTEQEYLAKHLIASFPSISQKNISQKTLNTFDL